MQCDWVGALKPGGGYSLEAVPGGTWITMVERIEMRGPLKLAQPLLSLMFRSVVMLSCAISGSWWSSQTPPAEHTEHCGPLRRLLALS